jgi:hypothetical protein
MSNNIDESLRESTNMVGRDDDPQSMLDKVSELADRMRNDMSLTDSAIDRAEADQERLLQGMGKRTDQGLEIPEKQGSTEDQH